MLASNRLSVNQTPEANVASSKRIVRAIHNRDDQVGAGVTRLLRRAGGDLARRRRFARLIANRRGRYRRESPGSVPLDELVPMQADTGNGRPKNGREEKRPGPTDK